MSEQTKHTPGPWKYQKENGSPTTGQHMISGAKPGYLAEVRDCGSGDVEANSRLIAAAPELLEALRDMLSGWKYIRETHGDLYGVGWDRSESKAYKALAAIEELTKENND